jgi:hypothetical protein
LTLLSLASVFVLVAASAGSTLSVGERLSDRKRYFHPERLLEIAPKMTEKKSATGFGERW